GPTRRYMRHTPRSEGGLGPSRGRALPTTSFPEAHARRSDHPPGAPEQGPRFVYPVRSMSTALKGLDHLLELQELDLSVDRLRNRRETLESGDEVRAIRRQLEQAETRMGDVRLELDTVERQSRKLEGDIDSLSRKAKDEEGRLYDGSVANPKEL